MDLRGNSKEVIPKGEMLFVVVSFRVRETEQSIQGQGKTGPLQSTGITKRAASL